ncbi:MAG: DUF2971 domain-containing protein [Pseudomonadota bacterium]
MRLYNFLPNKYALSNLKLNRIKVATIDDLNDPFELAAAQKPDKEMRCVFHGFKGDMHAKFGLVCFSQEWSNPVMWSHYADKHRGICLGFDIPEKYLIKVNYADSLMTIEFDDENQENINEGFIQKLFCTKFTDWKYEKEWRMFVSLEETVSESGRYFFQFGPDMVLRDVILGPRCTSTANEIYGILGETEQPVSIRKSRLAFHSFKVVPNKRVPVKSTPRIT